MIKEKVDVKESEEILIEGESLIEKSYRIILHNDNVTLVQLVIADLLEVFKLEFVSAMDKVLEAEMNGKSIVKSGYTFSEANNKVNESNTFCDQISGGLQKITLTIEEEN